MAIWSHPNLSDLNATSRWDAESFSPFLRSLDKRLKATPRLSELATVSHPSEIQRIYSNNPDSILFLLAQNIRPMLPDTANEFRISSETAALIPSNRLMHGDVLVTRSGANSGMCSVYLGKDGECYTSGEGIIIRQRGGIDGAYLVAYLNTSFGQALCKRAMYGSGQPHIGPKYLELTHVPRLGGIEQKAANLVRAAHSEIENSRSLYPDAEAELLERLGWDKIIRFPPELSYIADFKTLEKTGRTDAEFYHPHFERLCSHLLKAGSASIGQFCPRPTRGVQPDIAEDGDVLVVDSKAVRPQGVEQTNAEYTSQAFFDLPANAKSRVRKNDVLLNSTGRGTIGRAACFQLDSKAICDNHVAILRPDEKYCNPKYLALFLNSPAGLAQSERYQTGSSGQLEIYPEHIQQFIVFLPRTRSGEIDLAWQNRLAEKVKAFTDAKVQARHKLEEAVQLVEKEVAISYRLKSN